MCHSYRLNALFVTSSLHNRRLSNFVGGAKRRDIAVLSVSEWIGPLTGSIVIGVATLVNRDDAAAVCLASSAFQVPA